MSVGKICIWFQELSASLETEQVSDITVFVLCKEHLARRLETSGDLPPVFLGNLPDSPLKQCGEE